MKATLKNDDTLQVSARIDLPLPATGMGYTYKRLIRFKVLSVKKVGKKFEAEVEYLIDEATAYVERIPTVVENYGNRVDTRKA